MPWVCRSRLNTDSCAPAWCHHDGVRSLVDSAGRLVDGPPRRGRPGAWRLTAAAVLALALWGYLNPGGFVWVGRLFDHPGLMLGLAIACLGADHLRHGRQGAGIGVIAAGIALGGALNLVVSVGGAPTGEEERLVAPDGGSTLVVVPWSQLIDPMWSIQIERCEGLFARRIDLGCVNGDDDNLNGVQWLDSRRIDVSVGDRERPEHLTVILDDAGRPEPGSVGERLRAC